MTDEATTEHVTPNEVELDDDALDLASGGQSTDQTTTVHSSTFIPFTPSY